MSIKNFGEVLQPHLKESSSIIDYNLEKLLPAGENYGSIIYKIEVKIKNGNGGQEILHLVAKTTPPKCWIWELFTIVVTFKKELIFYHTLAPILDQFVSERGMPEFLNFFPKYYGSRVSLQPDCDEIDEDAVLVLENLKVKGYDVCNRFIGFNLEVSKAVIDIMAIYHAVFISFREAHPLEFQQQILPPLKGRFTSFLTDERIKQLVRSYIVALKDRGYYFDSFDEKLNDLFKQRLLSHNIPSPDNIFNTCCHCDFWTNNILVKSEINQPVDVKLLDYQIIEDHPGSRDLIFFLYTSVELNILQEQTDYLINYYFERFIIALTKLKTDTSKFTRQAFDETIKTASQLELAHILTLLPPIFTTKGKAKELKDFKPEDFRPKVEHLHENYIARLNIILSEYVKRSWL